MTIHRAIREEELLGHLGWVQGLARHCERVRVIALEVGDVSELPQNVDVRTIGRKGRVRRYFRYRRALREAFGRDGTRITENLDFASQPTDSEEQETR